MTSAAALDFCLLVRVISSDFALFPLFNYFLGPFKAFLVLFGRGLLYPLNNPKIA